MADSCQIVFKWPSTSASHVIVTGTFDNWSQSVPMTKTGSGFEATVSVPWDTDIVYKFVVDGQWLIDHQQPQQYDGSGAVNNVTRTPSKAEPIPEPEPEPQPAAETQADTAHEPTPAEPIAEEPPVTAHEPQALDPASIVPVETAALIASAESSPPETNGHANGSAEPAVETKDFIEAQPGAAPEVVPLVPELRHATDPAPEAAAVEDPAASHHDAPILELLPSQDALPVAQPVEETAVVSPDAGAELTPSTPAVVSGSSATLSEHIGPSAAPLTDSAAPIPSGDVPAKVNEVVALEAQVPEAVEAQSPAHKAPVNDAPVPLPLEDVPAAVDDEAAGSNGISAPDDGPNNHSPAGSAPAEPAPAAEAGGITSETKLTPVEEHAVAPVHEVEEATPSAMEPPFNDAVAPPPADDIPTKVDEAVVKSEEATVAIDAPEQAPAAELPAAPAIVEEVTAGPAEAPAAPQAAPALETAPLDDAPTKADKTLVTVDSLGTTTPATSQEAPAAADAVGAKTSDSPAKVESAPQTEVEASATSYGAKDAPTIAEAKPRLNGKGTAKDKEKRRSRTMSGFGTLKGKLFPTAPSPAEENPEFGDNGESKAEDAVVESRPKRQSIFGRMRNVSLKTMFKSSSWIIWIIPLLIALSYAGVYRIKWEFAMPSKN